MTTTVLGIVYVVFLLAALWFLSKRATIASGRETFGDGFRDVRYMARRWVTHGEAGGRAVRHTTTGFYPSGHVISWLFVDVPVSENASVTSAGNSVNLPAQLEPLVALLRKADGFDQLDLISDRQDAPLHTLGVVTWFFHPGAGIMLRRDTKRIPEPKFVKQDVVLLVKMTDLLQNI